MKELTAEVVTPEVFDRRIIADPSLKDRIAGCTSVGFDHFRRGMSSQGVELKPYGPSGDQGVYCQLVEPVMVDVLRISLYGHAMGAEKLIRTNRDYGISATDKEALMSSGVSYKDALRTRLESNIVVELDELRDPDITRQAIAECRRTLRSPDVYLRAQRGSFVGLGHLGIQGDAFQSLAHTLRERRGVQVVYEHSEEFTEFLAGRAKLDGGEQQAVFVADPIPERFFLAVVPLGICEQRELTS